MGSGAPRSKLFVKAGARAPVPYVVDATVSDTLTVASLTVTHLQCITYSDTLTVNPAGVMDVFSLYRPTPSISRLDLLL